MSMVVQSFFAECLQRKTHTKWAQKPVVSRVVTPLIGVIILVTHLYGYLHKGPRCRTMKTKVTNQTAPTSPCSSNSESVPKCILTLNTVFLCRFLTKISMQIRNHYKMLFEENGQSFPKMASFKLYRSMQYHLHLKQSATTVGF